MTAITGTALYLSYGTGTPVVLNTDYRAFGESETGEVVDASAGSDTAKTYLTTLTDATATATIVLQAGTAFTAVWAVLAPLQAGQTLTWAPEGTAATKHKHYAVAIVTKREKSMEFNDLVVCDIAWQFSGAVTDGTY